MYSETFFVIIPILFYIIFNAEISICKLPNKEIESDCIYSISHFPNMSTSLISFFLVKILVEIAQAVMKTEVTKYFNVNYNNFIENAFFRGFIYTIFEITFFSVL